MIDFSDETYARILARQMKRVPDTLDKREGSIIQTALGPESWYLEGVYLDMDRMQKNVFAETAGGDSLDKIAAAYGLKRKPAVRAVKTGRFDRKVRLGFRASALSGLSGLIYRAAQDLGIRDNWYIYAMECETAGNIGNGYCGQLIPIDYVAGLTTAELTDTISEGSDEEEDDVLRRRIFTKIRNPSTSGNVYDYYNWALECAGVGAAKIFPLALGAGTVKVVIADSSTSAASDDLINKVALHIEELRPIGADVTVVSAQEKTIDADALVRIKAGLNLETVRKGFESALTAYLQSQAFDVTYVSMARIGNLLLDTDGVEDYAGLRLNGKAENISLLDEEIAVTGTVTLTEQDTV